MRTHSAGRPTDSCRRKESLEEVRRRRLGRQQPHTSGHSSGDSPAPGSQEELQAIHFCDSVIDDLVICIKQSILTKVTSVIMVTTCMEKYCS